MLAMNYKNLNYEIETLVGKTSHLRLLPMNYKNLNYEIETRLNTLGLRRTRIPMNYKNLNYEIETLHV